MERVCERRAETGVASFGFCAVHPGAPPALRRWAQRGACGWWCGWRPPFSCGEPTLNGRGGGEHGIQSSTFAYCSMGLKKTRVSTRGVTRGSTRLRLETAHVPGVPAGLIINACRCWPMPTTTRRSARSEAKRRAEAEEASPSGRNGGEGPDHQRAAQGSRQRRGTRSWTARRGLPRGRATAATTAGAAPASQCSRGGSRPPGQRWRDESDAGVDGGLDGGGRRLDGDADARELRAGADCPRFGRRAASEQSAAGPPVQTRRHPSGKARACRPLTHLGSGSVLVAESHSRFSAQSLQTLRRAPSFSSTEDELRPLLGRTAR